MTRKVQGITVQLLNNKGEAVDRQWFKHLNNAYEWLYEMYPNWEKNFSIEIFSDQKEKGENNVRIKIN